ncbi:hypothetical protein I3843_06G023800 [Carya illinoinensis]|uniref:Exo_endo_phos domain-containing protein n=1 Tax=Carya illinoinensis TaxID=32201 RepID=A0A922ETF6_CARIL|nr:hypothetical protein I3842_06G024900 [Carya illinoinensis]KAG7973982.1 hypothetical protein I3843_06G023800 [Carya illinoinensis]
MGRSSERKDPGHRRKLFLELLRSLTPKDHEAWCVVGDFNEILFQNEKIGSRQRAKTQLSQFQDALKENRLFDLGCCCDFFTWSNKHSDHSSTKERNVHESKGGGLSARCSNHTPILLSMDETSR